MIKLLWLFVLVVFCAYLHEANACCCCGSGSGSGSRKGGSSLNGMIMGFLMARMTTGNAALASTYRNALLLNQYPTNPVEMLWARANPMSLRRLRTLRRQNGYGFLWGSKRAQRLKTIADVLGTKRALTGWPFTSINKLKDNAKQNDRNATSTMAPYTKEKMQVNTTKSDAHTQSGTRRPTLHTVAQ